MVRLLSTGAVVIALAGCSFDEAEETEPGRTATTTSAEPGATDSEVRAVIEDWYLDGVFDDPHRCSAVKAALDRLPTGGRDNFPVREDMRALERRTCLRPPR